MSWEGQSAADGHGSYRMRFENCSGPSTMVFKKLDDRLLHYLQAKARATGNQTLSMTHQQIADEMHGPRVVRRRGLWCVRAQLSHRTGGAKIAGVMVTGHA